MIDNREQRLWREFDRFAVWGAILVCILLSIMYFWIAFQSPLEDTFWETLRNFALDILADLIPVLILFMLSYAFFRKWQKIRSESETSELVDKLTQSLTVQLEKINNRIITDNTFSQRNKIPPLHDFLSGVKTLDVVGASLLAVLIMDRELLIAKIRDGCKVRLLCLNPLNNELVEMAYLLTGAPNSASLIAEIKASLGGLEGINSSKEFIEVRIYDKPLAHTMLITDGDAPQGKMRVELYVVEVGGPNRPGFLLEKSNAPQRFNTFMDEFEKMWETATPYSW